MPKLSHTSLSACGGGAVASVVMLGWFCWMFAAGVDRSVFAAGLTETDEMVFFTPS